LSIRPVHNNAHEDLGYDKVYAPRHLTEKHINQHWDTTLHIFSSVKKKKNKFPESTVTDEETRVDHFTPQTKEAGMQLKHLTSLTAKKFKVCQSAGKVMASVFCDAGVIHVEFMCWNKTINAKAYCNML
jgi:hypothetical protein